MPPCKPVVSDQDILSFGDCSAYQSAEVGDDAMQKGNDFVLLAERVAAAYREVDTSTGRIASMLGLGGNGWTAKMTPGRSIPTSKNVFDSDSFKDPNPSHLSTDPTLKFNGHEKFLRLNETDKLYGLAAKASMDRLKRYVDLLKDNGMIRHSAEIFNQDHPQPWDSATYFFIFKDQSGAVEVDVINGCDSVERCDQTVYKTVSKIIERFTQLKKEKRCECVQASQSWFNDMTTVETGLAGYQGTTKIGSMWQDWYVDNYIRRADHKRNADGEDAMFLVGNSNTQCT